MIDKNNENKIKNKNKNDKDKDKDNKDDIDIRYIFFDIDGNMIGDVYLFILEANLIDILYKNPEEKEKRTQQLHDKIVKYLKKGLLRKHIKDFITIAQNRIPSIRFFFYTAATRSWAKTIVKALEEALDFTFSRPILSYDHCIIKKGKNLKKSLIANRHIIEKSGPKNGRNKRLKESKNKWLNRCIMFDDIFHNLLEPENKRLIFVPRHDFTILYDPLEDHDKDYLMEKKKDVLILLHTFGYDVLPESLNVDIYEKKHTELNKYLLDLEKQNVDPYKMFKNDIKDRKKYYKLFNEKNRNKKKKQINKDTFGKIKEMLFEPLPKNINDDNKGEYIDIMFSDDHLHDISKEMLYNHVKENPFYF